MKHKLLSGVALMSVGLMLFSCKKDDEPVTETPVNKGELIVDGKTYALDGCDLGIFGNISPGDNTGLYDIDLDIFTESPGIQPNKNVIYFSMISNQEEKLSDGTYNYYESVNGDSTWVYTFEEAYIYLGYNSNTDEYAEDYSVFEGSVVISNTANGLTATYSGRATSELNENFGDTVSFSGNYSGTYEKY